VSGCGRGEDKRFCDAGGRMMGTKVDEWFEALTEQQAPLLAELRQHILGSHSIFVEEIKWGHPCYSLRDLVCYLQKAKTHVTLGFQQGAHLRDARRLLQGDGKDMRHINYALNETINARHCRDLIEEAIRYDSR
jgi:hypothetical protein